MKKNIVYPLVAVVVSVVLAGVAVLLPLISVYNIVLPSEYYFVCYKSGDDAQSVGIVNSTVQNYGGAGYTLNLDGEYVSAVACYYSIEDAEKVSAAFFDSGIECAVYGVQVSEYALALRYRDDVCRIEGALKTFCQLASIYYSLANAIDGGVIDGGSACAIIEDADAVFLNTCSVRENAENKIYHRLEMLHAERKKGNCSVECKQTSKYNNPGPPQDIPPQLYTICQIRQIENKPEAIPYFKNRNQPLQPKT